MFTHTTQTSTAGRGQRGSVSRLALVCTVTVASVAVLTAGPAHARVETPQDTGGRAVQADVSPTRVAGLYGVHVNGGWLLR
ncbi:MAG TPA: hypothetical protein VFG72_00880 [Marmoricola sp.]|nr:hypothetical protein [Marmoricola sp.]